MSKKPVVLMILDGYGLNKTHEGNAVYEAKKPVMDRLMKECPFVEGQASGLANFDWLSIMDPLLERSKVKISMVI